MVRVTPMRSPSPRPVRANFPHPWRMSLPARLIMVSSLQGFENLHPALRRQALASYTTTRSPSSSPSRICTVPARSRRPVFTGRKAMEPFSITHTPGLPLYCCRARGRPAFRGEEEDVRSPPQAPEGGRGSAEDRSFPRYRSARGSTRGWLPHLTVLQKSAIR